MLLVTLTRRVLLASMLVLTGWMTTAMAAGTGFTPTAPMAEARESAMIAVLGDGRVLVAGGNGVLGAPLATAEVYDPEAGNWTPTGSMGTARAGAATTTLPDGRVLVAGGASGLTPLSSAEAYDPLTEAWSPVADSEISGFSRFAVTLRDGTVLLMTSGDGIAPRRYNPWTDTWSPTGLTTGPVHEGARGAVLEDGSVLVVGVGRSRGANLFDPDGDTFRAPSGGMVDAEAESRTVVPLGDGRVLVAGGTSGVSTVAGSEIYDPTTETFTATAGPLPTPTGRAEGVTLRDGSVMLVGGVTGAAPFAPAAAAQEYAPAAGAFAPSGSLVVARTRASVASMSNGQVLVAGGVGAFGGPLASAEVYSGLLPGAALSPTTADLGHRAVGAGASSSSTLRLRSIGDAPLVLDATGPGLTGADADAFRIVASTCAGGLVLPVGASCAIAVAFAPTRTGPVTAALAVPSSAGPVETGLTGTGDGPVVPPPAPPASNRVTVAMITPTGSWVSSRVSVAGQGTVRQEAVRTSPGEMATSQACVTARTAMQRGTLALVCRLSAAVRRARRSGPLRVRLVTTFTPTGGTPRTVRHLVALPATGPSRGLARRHPGAVAG